MSDKGGYVKGRLTRVGVKKGNVISEQENEIYRDTYDEAVIAFADMVGQWWDSGSGMDSEREYTDDRLTIRWVVGDTRSTVELWVEREE